MVILIPLNAILFELFPEANGDRDALVEAMRRYYTVRGVAPEVTLEEGSEAPGPQIRIALDVAKLAHRARERSQALALCEKGKFADARKILLRSAEEDPSDSECHRVQSIACHGG